MYAIQVFYNNEWVWVTHTVENKDSTHRVVSQFESEEQAKEVISYWTDQHSKIRIVRLEDEV